MFRRQQAVQRGFPAGNRDARRASSHRASSLSLRLSLVVFVLLSFAPLGFGIMTIFPQARLSDVGWMSLRAWQHLLAALPAFRGSRDVSVAAAIPASKADLPRAVSYVPNEGEVGLIAYGDRLKISFFESLGVTLDTPEDGSEQAVAAVFPRMDLSGEYLVDEAGVIDIPRLGQLAAPGQTIAALQSALAARFQRAVGRTSDVHVTIVDRQPVYIIGSVHKAGPVKHTPGMIVLQALANAGGVDQGIADTSSAIERIRETERQRQAEDKLDRLRVRRAELIAERDNADSIEIPADIRSRLTERHLQEVLAGATATLSIEREGRQQQAQLAERRVGIARLEVAGQERRADQLKDLVVRKREKLHEVEVIAARGSVSQYKVIDMSAEISELESRHEDLRVALVQAQGRLIEALSVEARVKFDASLAIQRELAATQQEIDDCRRSIGSMQAVIRALQGGPIAVPGESPGRLSVRITRRVQMRFSVIPANEMTPLLPGDVLQVDAGGPSDLPVSRVAGESQRLQN